MDTNDSLNWRLGTDQTLLNSESMTLENEKSGPDIKVVPSGNSTEEITVGHVVHLNASDDIAAKYVDENVTLDAATERRLLRKADIYICSIMCFVYCLQFMDKVSNSAAAIMDMRSDLNMTGNMYSWVGSSFYLGYLVFEVPVSFLLQKLPLAKTTGVIIILWGTVMAASAASQSYAGYITSRTVLGALEGAITPSFIVLTSQWYKRNEQFSRTAFWFGCNGMGNILASGIGYGLWNNTSLPIAGWRLLFVIMGVMTIFIGAVFVLHMPDDPSSAWFLTEQEKVQQVERIRENKQGYGNHHIKWYQVKEAFIDPRTYLYFCITLINNIPNGGITNFQSILIEGMGYTSGRTLLIGMAPGAVEFVGCWLTGFVAMYFLNKYRYFYSICGATLTVMCLCLLAWGPNNSAKLAGLCIYNWSSPINYLSLLSSISSNSAGHTKKVFMGAAILVGYCVGNLVGPQTFKASEAPTYPTAKTAMAACSCVTLGLTVALFLVNVFENRRRDMKNEKLPASVDNPEFADLTDFENPEFRYAL